MSSVGRTTANMPNPAASMTGPDGRLVPEWTALILALLARTGGEGSPIDIATLQDQVNKQGKQIDDLFLLENSSATGALFGALLRRLIALEATIQAVVPVQMRAPQSLPDPVSIAPRASDDLRKLIEARK